MAPNLYAPPMAPLAKRAAVLALARALGVLLDTELPPEHATDPDALERVTEFQLVAHIFALPVRRLALGVVLLRANIKRHDVLPDPMRAAMIEAKAQRLLDAAAYFASARAA